MVTMGIFRWLFGSKTNEDYKTLEPQKYVWYRYYSLRYGKGYSGGKFEVPELPEGIGKDAFDLKPYAYLNNKRYRARFYITKKFCVITTKKYKIAIPLMRCSFRYKVKCFNSYNDGTTDKYYVTVLVKGKLSVEDFEMYKKFRTKVVSVDRGGYKKKIGFIQGRE